ncbi:Uncharacterised protein [Yersinia enterocolitica]|nr:Uncharacterised protein [Yersinia enterocolitica]
MNLDLVSVDIRSVITLSPKPQPSRAAGRRPNTRALREILPCG